MPMPDLPNWTATSRSLHQVVSLVGPIHKALLPERNNYLHLPMRVRRVGLDSQTLPGGRKIQIDFKKGFLSYGPPEEPSIHLQIREYTQKALFERLLAALEQDGLGPALGLTKGTAPVDALMAHLRSQGKAGASLSEEDLSGQSPLAFDTETASAYTDVLYAVFTGLARFSARLEGTMTPLAVWPEHFDLSTLWFPPSNRGMDDEGPHLSFGFAPFTPGQFPDPYLYAYAHPYPESRTLPPLPLPARWHEEGWKGAVVEYGDMAVREDPEEFLEEMAFRLHEVLSRLLEGGVS